MPPWTAIYEYALFPYMFIPILLETFGISLTKFKVTSKGNGTDKEKDNSFVYKIPFIILVVLSLIGVVRSIITIFASGSLGPIVVVFWLINNFYAMVMCLFFAAGRAVYRGAERVRVAVSGVLSIDGRRHNVVTKDISETGVALYIDEPFLVENGEGHNNILELYDGKWSTKLRVEIKHTEEQKYDGRNVWLYSFAIVEHIGAGAYDQLLAILYDRVTTNPTEIRKTHSVYDELSTNLKKRMTVTRYRKRHYPRIGINAPVPVIVNGRRTSVEVQDFNYQYFSTKEHIAAPETGDEDRVVFLIGSYRLEAEFERQEQELLLYRVLDFEKLYFEKELRDDIMKAVLTMCGSDVNVTEEAEKQSGRKDKEEEQFREMDML